MRESDYSRMNVLVISEHTNPEKIERHIGPLGTISNETTMVCLTQNRDVDLDYIHVPSFGNRLLGIILIFPFALCEAIRNEYDLIVSFSLFPYGLYALLTGATTRVPTHLGIIGADLDVHAHAWYQQIPKTAFKKFDSISVLGSEHKAQLTEYNIPEQDIFILTNAIDTESHTPKRNRKHATFDFVWSGRFAPEKDPVLFIEAVHQLEKRGYDVQAVMLGSGELKDAIEAVIIERDLIDTIELPGWVNEPAEYYAESRIFVLTSKREALGLSLIESMAMGLACVTPRVGNIPDIATDGENALLVDHRDASGFADEMERLITDEVLYSRLSSNAVSVGQSFSYESAQNDWREITEHTIR